MTQIILIALGIVIIAILLTQKGRKKTKQATEKIVGICAAAIGQDAKKRENKEIISALLKEKGEMSNSDIRKALGVSDRSVIRYMDELEREGKVEQVGDIGRGVTYRLK